MLSERTRNVIVGLTIIVALAVCMYGIILLGKFPAVASLNEYSVTLISSDANGVSAGSKVELNGVYAGQVRNVYTADNQGKLVARTELEIDKRIKIPASTSAVLVRPTAGVGNSSVELKANSSSGPFLTQDGTAILDATASSSELIPQSVFTDIHVAAEGLTSVEKDLHALLVYTPPEALENANPNDPNRPRPNASTVIIRLDRTIDSLQKLLTDPKLQANVRDAVQNITDASNQLKSTLQRINAFADSAGTVITSVDKAAGSIGAAATRASTAFDSAQRDINHVSDQLVQTLAQLDKTMREITEGNGTTGRLINDPRLYEGLLDLSKSLKSTADDLDFLLKKWKDEGVNLHLK